MSVLIIDYGMGNLFSVTRSFEECGATVSVSQNPQDLETASHIILPGVGAFGDGMTHLKEQGWIAPLQKAVLDQKTPLLGICLGMQLLASSSEEGDPIDGLDFIPGQVKKLVAQNGDERIPHIGWNEVYPKSDNKLFEGIEEGTDFYFVHSYHYIPKDKKTVLADTPYCGNFVSVVKKGNVLGTQFHPEKSSKPGFELIKNFLSMESDA